jgi:phenylalanyl-tRNA synthetase beta chain
MRPSLLETGLESISWNINRKNSGLRFFEFGKSYQTRQTGHYTEINHCCLYITGNPSTGSWKAKSVPADYFYLKGICESILRLAGVEGEPVYKPYPGLGGAMEVAHGKYPLLVAGEVSAAVLSRFDIRQPVYYADLNWDNLMLLALQNKILFSELPRQNPVNRDLALIVEKSLPFESVEKTIQRMGLGKLKEVQLFDIFESGKLGKDKKSLAISFTFLDPEKTLTDKEIDEMMGRIIKTTEQELRAEIRK